LRVSVILDGSATAEVNDKGKIEWDIDDYTEVSDIVEVSCPLCYEVIEGIDTMEDLLEALMNSIETEDIREAIFRRDNNENI
jgi:hypothetical protein